MNASHKKTTPKLIAHDATAHTFTPPPRADATLLAEAENVRALLRTFGRLNEKRA